MNADQSEHAPGAGARTGGVRPSRGAVTSAAVMPPNPSVASSGAGIIHRAVPAGDRVAQGIRHSAERDQRRRERERDHAREHPPPGDRVHQPSAEQRAQGSRDRGPPRPLADGGAPVLFDEQLIQQGQAVGHHQRPERTLGQASGQQRGAAAGDRAERRRGAEADQPDREDPRPRVPVAQRATEQDERAQRQQVGVHHPLQPVEAERELAPQRGERHRGHGALEEDRARAEDCRRQRPAAGGRAQAMPELVNSARSGPAGLRPRRRGGWPACDRRVAGNGARPSSRRPSCRSP